MLFVCADELLWVIFLPPPYGSGRVHGEVLTTSSAVSQSRDATVTAAHVALLACVCANSSDSSSYHKRIKTIETVCIVQYSWIVL